MATLSLLLDEGEEALPADVPQRVLGLDLSLAATGLVVLNRGELQAQRQLRAGERREAERLAWLLDRVHEVIAEHGIQLVAIEGYSYGSRNMSHQLGELGGVIRLDLYRSNLPYMVIPPGTWRKQLFGNGLMPKDRVRYEIFKRYAEDFPSISLMETGSVDVLEAWAVAMAAWRTAQGLDQPAPKRRAAVRGVRRRRGEKAR